MKKAKSKKSSSKRVGAVGLKASSPVTKLLAVAAGYFLIADPLNKELDKLIPPKAPAPTPQTTTAGFLDNLDMIGLGEAGAGAALLFLGKPSLIKTIAGGILVGAGVKRLTTKQGTTSGYQSVPVVGAAGRRRMAGYQSTPVIGAVPAQLQGVPAQLQGYRVNGANGYQSAGSGVMGSVNYSRDAAGAGVAVGNSSGYLR